MEKFIESVSDTLTKAVEVVSIENIQATVVDVATEVAESVSAAAEAANEVYANPTIITNKVSDAMADPSTVLERYMMLKESDPVAFWSMFGFFAVVLYLSIPYFIRFLRVCCRVATCGDDGFDIAIKQETDGVKLEHSGQVEVKSGGQDESTLTEVRGGYGGANNVSIEQGTGQVDSQNSISEV